MPIETVKSRLQRGLAELERALDRDFGERREWQRALLVLASSRRPPASLVPWIAAGTVGLTIVVAWEIARSPFAPVPGTAHVVVERPTRESAVVLGPGLDTTRRAVPGRSSPGTRSTDASSERAEASTGSRRPLAGPVFEIDCTFPPGLGPRDFDALLELEGQEAPAAERQVAALDDVPTPRACFDHVPRTSLLGGGASSIWRLVLVSHDGAWSSLQRLPAHDESEPILVRFELAPRARLDALVRAADGRVVGDARIRIRDATGGLAAEARTNAEGRCSIGGLVPGRFDVCVRAAAQGETRESVELQALEHRELDLVVDPRPVPALAGRLWSRSGSHVPRGNLRFVAVDDPTFVVEAAAVAEPDQPGSWRFQAALAPGTYQVFPPMDDAFAWSPASTTVAVPGGEIAFTCRDDVRTELVELRAADEATGRPLEEFRATILLDRYDTGRRAALAIEPRALQTEAADGVARFAGLPAGTRGWWLVEADGHASTWGELGDLTRVDGRAQTLARLAHDWSASFWVGARDEFGRPIGLEGACIRTRGGTCLARTLANGEARVELLFEPGRIQVDLDGWRVSAIEGFSNGRRTRSEGLHRVWMVRD